MDRAKIEMEKQGLTNTPGRPNNLNSQAPANMEGCIDLTNDANPVLSVNISEWPLPLVFETVEIDLTEVNYHQGYRKIWMRDFIDPKSKLKENRHTLFLNGIKQTPFSCSKGKAKSEDIEVKIPKTEKIDVDETGDSLKPSSQFDYVVKDNDWLQERLPVVSPPTKEKRISAVEKAKFLSKWSNWKLYIEIKKKLEAHKLVNIEDAKAMSEKYSSAEGSVGQLEKIPSNTECFDLQNSILKDVDSTISEHIKNSPSSMYAEPVSTNTAAHHRKRDSQGDSTDLIPRKKIKREFPTGASATVTSSTAVSSNLSEYTDNPDTSLEISSPPESNKNSSMIPPEKIKREIPTGVSTGKETSRRPVASDFFEYTENPDPNTESSDTYRANMAFRMVSENIREAEQYKEGVRAVSREVIDYSDLDKEVDMVMSTSNKAREDISELIREAKQDKAQSTPKPISPVVWDSDHNNTVPSVGGGQSRYAPRGILTEWDQDQEEPYNQEYRGYNNLYPRKCILCHYSQRNMKRHVISYHMSEWWGVYGDLTCWYCRQYQTNIKISTCNGDFIPFTDTETLVNRHKDINFMKDDLELKTEFDLVNLVINEGLCDNSNSPFSATEIFFLELVDSSLGLNRRHHYNANNPTRVTELLHWQTMAELIRYARIRGVITGQMTPSHPIKYIDTVCNVPAMYSAYRYQGTLQDFPPLLENSDNKYLDRVITDVVDPQFLNSIEFSRLLSDPKILISIGIHPDRINHCTNSFLSEIEALLRNPKVVALSVIDINLDPDGYHYEKQLSIFTSMLRLANRSTRPLRLSYRGPHKRCLNMLREHLHPKHKIHLLKFTGTYDEAIDFLLHFPNGFLGVTKFSCNLLGGPLNLVNRISVLRMVPGSNSPFKPIPTPGPTLPIDISELINILSSIKKLTPFTVAKHFRKNVLQLYNI